jgi:xanthine dehydrogenase YagS FAD-binding subunit
MKEFKIAQPQSLDQASSLLSEKKDGYFVMAGGTDLLDEIKNGIVGPEVVVDLATIPGLSFIQEAGSWISVGAMTRVAELAGDPTIQENFPVLREAAISLASPQLRNVGTVGGNLCQRPRCWYFRDPDTICRKKGGSRCYAFRGKNRYHAIFGGGVCYIVYPSDLAPALISLGAEAVIGGPAGEKNLPLEEFYILPQVNVRRENILQEGEILREIRIPLPKNGAKSTYYKMRERSTWDFALVSAAVNGILSEGTFREISIIMGGVAPIPWRLKKAEDYIKGKKVTEEVIRQGAKEALEDARPLQDNAYKLDLVEAVLHAAILPLV